MVGRNKKYSDEELYEIIRDLYHNWGDTVYDTIDLCSDMPNSETYSRRLDCISKVRDELDIDKYKYNKDVNIEYHLRELREIERSGTVVTSDDINLSLFDDSTSSTDVRKMANLNFPTGLKRRSHVDMIEQLRSIDNNIISNSDIESKTDYSANSYAYEFGSKTKAIHIAGKYNANHNSDFWNTVTNIPNPDEALDSIDGYEENANYYVYRIHFDNSFYIGMTNDICRRMSVSSTSNRSRWPSNCPTNIDIESFYDINDASDREKELTLETAIEFDTNEVYGGHHKYKNAYVEK